MVKKGLRCAITVPRKAFGAVEAWPMACQRLFGDRGVVDPAVSVDLFTAAESGPGSAMSRIFGKIAQIGYVVRDIDASMDQWVRRGVGPRFYVDWVQTDYFLYRGAESELEVSVAVANSGDIQLELIQQRNDAPSAFKEFLDAGHEGAQHVAYWTDDFQSLYDKALSLGYTVTQEGSIGGEHGRFAAVKGVGAIRPPKHC
jgi:hypothetical protein